MARVLSILEKVTDANEKEVFLKDLWSEAEESKEYSLCIQAFFETQTMMARVKP